jgi:hypothetical protein
LGILEKHVTNFALKPVCGTRWESRIVSLKPLRYNLSGVCDVLEEISQDDRLSGLNGNTMKVEVNGLLKNITKFKFIASLIMWYNNMFLK